MGNCVKLKWNRKRLGLSQQEFADKVGLSVGTIRKLEWDETAWLTVRNDTVDKIQSLYDNMASWQPENANEVIETISEENEGTEVVMEEQEMCKVEKETEKVVDSINTYNENDKHCLSMIEFIVENLKESESHLEFATNIKLLKKVINKY